MDNIVYRLGWAPTLLAARQLVTHGHISVNQKRVTIPSYICLRYEIIKVRSINKSFNLVRKKFRENIQKVPSHLSLNIENLTATINQQTDRSEIELKLNELLIIEYYSNRLLYLNLRKNKIIINFQKFTNHLLCLELFFHLF